MSDTETTVATMATQGKQHIYLASALTEKAVSMRHDRESSFESAGKTKASALRKFLSFACITSTGTMDISDPNDDIQRELAL